MGAEQNSVEASQATASNQSLGLLDNPNLNGSGPEDPRRLENNMRKLQERMEQSEWKIDTVTDAMKTTLTDLRALMQEMDNPFNFLQEMGVDSLVDKAVEQVADEVKKAQREKTKNDAIQDDGRQPQSQRAQGNVSLGRTSQSRGGSALNPAQTLQQKHAPRPQNVQSMPVIAEITERIGQTESEIKNISDSVKILTEVLQTVVQKLTPEQEATTVEEEKPVEPKVAASRGKAPFGEIFGVDGAYYEAYVSLVSDYLILRMGEKRGEQMLLEGMYKGWARPEIVRDVVDNMSSKMKRGEDVAFATYGFGFIDSEIEDKILLTSLINNLDKPPSQWEEPTHLFLLLALVTRTRETKRRKQP